MALTPEQLAELQRLRQMFVPLAEQARRDAQRQANMDKSNQNKANGGLVDFLKDSEVKEPLYHGTDKDFTQFKTHPRHQMGAHFGSQEQANQFASKNNGRVIPAHIKIKNAYEAQTDLGDWSNVDRWKDYLYNWEHGGNGPIDPSEEEIESLKTPAHVRKLLESRGYDGIQYYNQIEGKHDDDDSDGRSKENRAYIAFHPHQIKSALGNSGAYDTTKKDITKANGGNVSMDAMRLALAKGGSITHAHQLEIEERPL